MKHHRSKPGDVRIADAFHEVFYRTERFASIRWRGHECWKYPTDLIVYAELVHELEPEIILETGTYRGGSALFFADMLELVGPAAQVITVDIHSDTDLGPDPAGRCRPVHDRIEYVHGSSTDPLIVSYVRQRIEGHKTLVVLDSEHTDSHVTDELAAYADLAAYLVVEDTNLGGNPVLPGWGPGPMEAVRRFLADHPEWERDEWRERLLLTCAPNGFLRRR